MTPEPTEGWDGDRRRDGLLVAVSVETVWTIVATDGTVLDHCPCCGKGLPTRRIAKLVADRFFPVHEIL